MQYSVEYGTDTGTGTDIHRFRHRHSYRDRHKYRYTHIIQNRQDRDSRLISSVSTGTRGTL